LIEIGRLPREGSRILTLILREWTEGQARALKKWRLLWDLILNNVVDLLLNKVLTRVLRENNGKRLSFLFPCQLKHEIDHLFNLLCMAHYSAPREGKTHLAEHKHADMLGQLDSNGEALVIPPQPWYSHPTILLDLENGLALERMAERDGLEMGLAAVNSTGLHESLLVNRCFTREPPGHNLQKLAPFLVPEAGSEDGRPSFEISSSVSGELL
jgi:hypothetical protein